MRRRARTALFDINLDLMLGRLYAQTGDFEKALPLLRHVVDDQPGYQEGALLLAADEESAGHPDAAIQTLEQTLEVNPNSTAVSSVWRSLRADRAWPQAAARAGEGAGAQHPESVHSPRAARWR